MQKGIIYLDFYQPQGQGGIFPWKKMVSFLDANSARQDFLHQVSTRQHLKLLCWSLWFQVLSDHFCLVSPQET